MKITAAPSKSTVTFQTQPAKNNKVATWWKAPSNKEAADQLLGTANFLKESQGYRYRAAALYARLYGNVSLYNFVGANIAKVEAANSLPVDRPTFNLIQSAADTLVSRISQSRPNPVFLTDGGDYKERNLAKKLNNFVAGEFYRTKTYEKTATMLRDGLVEGTGCVKVFATQDKKVGIERRLLTELLVDPNEAIYGEPRRLYEIKLVDRAVLSEMFPEHKATLNNADKAYTDASGDSSKTVSDMVMVVEGWSLPSAPGAKDGRHTIACTAGLLFDEKWTKDRFPFVFLHYSPRLLGFWAQGLAEQLMGTQLEINSLLYTISKAIKLVGVPRVFVEQGSKVVKAQMNNDVGSIVTYSGTKPSYEVAQCVPQELYAQLQRLVDYGYQQSGVSALQATSQKPAGLNSGEAIRSYDDISTDRFASLSRRYDDVFVELAQLIVETATEIVEEEGSYSTVFPDKNGIKEIDFPKLTKKNPYVIQVFNQSSLPRDPAGRLQKVAEMIQSGMITIREGRRLLDFPDIQQIEKLANAAEERIFQMLDAIIEDGEEAYEPPDPFTDIQLGEQTVVQYINLYAQCKLEEDKMSLLRKWYSQIQGMKQAATPPTPPEGGEAAPTAAPEPTPTSPLVPNSAAGAPTAGMAA